MEEESKIKLSISPAPLLLVEGYHAMDEQLLHLKGLASKYLKSLAIWEETNKRQKEETPHVYSSVSVDSRNKSIEATKEKDNDDMTIADDNSDKGNWSQPELPNMQFMQVHGAVSVDMQMQEVQEDKMEADENVESIAKQLWSCIDG